MPASSPVAAPTQKQDAKPTQTTLTTGQPGLGFAAPQVDLSLGDATYRPRQMTSDQVLYLQRTIGNRAVTQFLDHNAARPHALAGPPAHPFLVQTKLTVGPADDAFEREADRIADSVQRSAHKNVRENRREEDELPQPATDAPTISRVQRTAAPVGPDGGALAGDLESRIRRTQSSGSALPSAVRGAIEPQLGADLSSVKVHTDSHAVQLNRELGAKAFTHQNHIYYGAGQSPGDLKLTAHEAVHTVQQGAVRRTSDDGAVQRAMPTGVIQRKGFFDWIKGMFSKKKAAPTTKTTGEGTGKTGGEGTGKTTGEGTTTTAPKNVKDTTTVPTKTGTTEAPTGPDPELQDSIEYERRLGRYGFMHGKAVAAAKAVLDKMTSAMIGDFKEEDETQKTEIVKLYGSDSVDSAGQVGKNFDAIMGVLHEGNLRERMTALYNAMFGGFKSYLNTALKKGRWQELEAKGLNVTKLQRRKRQMIFTPGARDLYRNPYQKWDRKNLKSYEDFGPSMRKEVKGTSQRTVGELEEGENPIPLSEREKAFQFGDKEEGTDLKNEKLKWREGETNWQINDNNPWVKNAKQSLKMPVVAGPSGTMLRMFQLWEWLNKPTTPEDWRLAVLSWMLTSNDHTFHEMMMASADYGLPYKPGREAYMDVAPLSVMELRGNVAQGGLFPHEIAFKRMFDEGKMNLIMDDDAIEDATDELEGKQAKDVGALSGPAAAAIRLYTSFGYLILNPVLRGGPQGEAMIIKAIKEKDELSQFRGDFESGKLDVKTLIEQARRVIPLLMSSLEMLPDWKGHLYRGTASDSRFAFMGSSFKFDKLGSATMDIDVAKDFANNFNTGKYKYIMELDVTAGKDLREISEAAEDEVVLPPGSAFTITKRQKPTKDDPYYHIFMNQTGRGGRLLSLGERPVTPKDEDDSSTGTDEDDVILNAYYDKDDSVDAAKGYYFDEKDDFGEFEDLSDGWVDIVDYKDGTHYFVKKDEYDAFLNPVAKTKPTTENKPKPAPVTAYIAPDDDCKLTFQLMDPGEIQSHIECNEKPGWSMVTILDDEGSSDYFVKTPDLNTFLGVGTTSKTKTETQPKEEPETGLDPADYPAGDFEQDIKGFLTLPASLTEKGAYDTQVELFPGEKITAHVTDEMTQANGRCSVVFFGETYYVPLKMLVPKKAQDKLAVAKVVETNPTPELTSKTVEKEEPIEEEPLEEITPTMEPISFRGKDCLVYFEWEEWDMLEQQQGITGEMLKKLTPGQVETLAYEMGMEQETVQAKINSI